VTPSVSVVVPVHADRGRLELTLDALDAQDYAGPVEVLVVDNGDNPTIPSATSGRATTRVLREPAPGSYAARNTGVAEASGAVLAFTDADCVPRPDWLSAAVAALMTHERAFVGGAIALFPRPGRRPRAAEVYDCANGLRQDRYVGEQGWAATANMLVRRATFDEVGPFDARLRSGGDRLWGRRAAALGVRPTYAADAVVDHPARDSLRELRTKTIRVTTGDVDARRLDGRPVFDPGTLLSEVRPHTRSIARASARVSPTWTRDRVVYVLVAHWLQYVSVLTRLRG
jgi:GT2 family glycosyltransferase